MTDILTRDEVVGLAWGDFCTEDVDRLLAHDAALRAALDAALAAQREAEAARDDWERLAVEAGFRNGVTSSVYPELYALRRDLLAKERRIAEAERERDALRDACRRLYLAGRWRRDGFKSEQDAAEWEAFRDAAAIQPGTATDAGVSG